MQIEIYNPAQGQPIPAVEWNYPEVKKWLEDGLAAYKGRVYTEETITQAKKDRANLNKLADAIAVKRREMKAVYLHPYEDFEAQAKELEGMVKAQSAEIDAQVKAFEDSRKEEKLEKIKAIYAKEMGDLSKLVPYEKIHDPKWLNVTVKISAVEWKIIEKAESIRAALASIDALGLPDDIAGRVKGVYLDRLDLAAALAEKDRIEREQQALSEYEAARSRKVYDAADPDAFKKAQPGDVIRFGGPGCESASVENQVPHEALGYAADEAPDLLTVDFRIHATREQLSALKSFLVANKIKYGPVPKK